nr:uncharacterized protein CTRU02_15091 [Colletotrichum truncatum]KAF6781451.1 hypothetical protein CTRU02_15091 [Colletotrichum truncatum]
MSTVTPSSLYYHVEYMHENIRHFLNELLSPAADGSGLDTTTASLEQYLSATVDNLADIEKLEASFVRKVTEILIASYEDTQDIARVLAETIREHDEARAAANKGGITYRFQAFVVSGWTTAWDWVRGTSGVQLRAAKRLHSFREPLHETIRVHHELSNVVNTGRDREVQVEAVLCKMSKALQDAVVFGEHKLEKARRQLVNTHGVSVSDVSDSRRSKVYIMGHATLKIRAIEATGSLLCIQAKETGKDLRWK